MGFAAVAAVGAAASIYGSSQAAGAAKDAAGAQSAASEQYQRWVRGQLNEAKSLVATPAAMAAHDQALHAQERQVSRQEELASSINPALIEQGKQLHSLIMGQSAPVLDNLKQQRSLQRQQLVSQLREQLGPGAETSTVGQQALAKFDAETANGLSSAQQDYTKMFLQGSLQAPGAMNAAGEANTQLSDINAHSPQAQQANLMAQFAGQGGQAQMAGIQSAGAGSLGTALQGQAIAGIGSDIMQLGSAYFGNKSVGETKATTSTPAAPAANGYQNGNGTLGNSLLGNDYSYNYGAPPK